MSIYLSIPWFADKNMVKMVQIDKDIQKKVKIWHFSSFFFSNMLGVLEKAYLFNRFPIFFSYIRYFSSSANNMRIMFLYHLFKRPVCHYIPTEGLHALLSVKLCCNFFTCSLFHCMIKYTTKDIHLFHSNRSLLRAPTPRQLQTPICCASNSLPIT